MEVSPAREAAARGSKADTREVAAGSGIVLAAAAVDQVARFGVTWLVASLLGAAVFGSWSYALTVVMLVGTVAPLGLHAGVVLFVARYLGSSDPSRAKGSALAALGLTAVTGSLGSLAVFALARSQPGWFGDADTAGLVVLASPAIALQAFLLAQIGTLRAFRDVRGFAMIGQVVLPVLLLTGAVVAIAGGWGLSGLVGALVVAFAIANVAAAGRVWRQIRGLRDVGARFQVGELLSFSIPQSVAILVAKLGLWLDVLLLAQLSTLEAVGLYRAAVSIAVMGGVLVMAVQSALNPVVAERLHRGERDEVADLVGTITRWIVLIAVPPFLIAATLPDLLLGVFSAEYAVSSGALAILLIGQAVAVSTGAVGPLVSMAGRSRLEMTNGLVAVGVALGLHLLLIPRFGAVGAAVASSTSYVVWGALRTLEARVLLGIQPFRGRTSALLGLAVGLVVVGRLPGEGAWVVERLGLTAVVVATFAVVAWRWAVTAEDRELWDAMVARVRRKLGRDAPAG